MSKVIVCRRALRRRFVEFFEDRFWIIVILLLVLALLLPFTSSGTWRFMDIAINGPIRVPKAYELALCRPCNRG
jgi:hypothetical protein